MENILDIWVLTLSLSIRLGRISSAENSEEGARTVRLLQAFLMYHIMTTWKKLSWIKFKNVICVLYVFCVSAVLVLQIAFLEFLLALYPRNIFCNILLCLAFLNCWKSFSSSRYLWIQLEEWGKGNITMANNSLGEYNVYASEVQMPHRILHVSVLSTKRQVFLSHGNCVAQLVLCENWKKGQHDWFCQGQKESEGQCKKKKKKYLGI